MKTLPCNRHRFSAVKIEHFIRFFFFFFFFFFFAQNIDCGYTLEPPRRGGSNEYPQSMFWSKNEKNRYTPANPSFDIQFCIKRWGLWGYTLHGHVFLMFGNANLVHDTNIRALICAQCFETKKVKLLPTYSLIILRKNN